MTALANANSYGAEYFREDKARVQVQAVEGSTTYDLGIWDTLTGAGVTATVTKHRPGGMREQIVLGSYNEVEDITVGRLYDETLHAIYVALAERVGSLKIVVLYQPLASESAPKGSQIKYEGVLMGVNRPDHNSEGTDAASLELVVACKNTVTTA
jgi:hypothetical protein